jgi:tRNA pseudouridine38-40 synthase
MHRYFTYLSFDGKPYSGWQSQPNGPTVQHRLQHALSTLLAAPTPITGSGRTDAGVHARQMVAHFDTDLPLPDPDALVDHLNRFLPNDIAIHRILPVHPAAHARFDALSRTYQYFISYHKDPFDCQWVYRLKRPLDREQMNKAAQILFEYSDFTSFSKLHTDTKTNLCQLFKAIWTWENNHLVFTIEADRFLRNMVRSIVGTLIEVGAGKLSTDGFRAIIEAKDRRKAGTSVPAHALFLTHVRYPESIFINEKQQQI